jgi:hypothetical protein
MTRWMGLAVLIVHTSRDILASSARTSTYSRAFVRACAYQHRETPVPLQHFLSRICMRMHMYAYAYVCVCICMHGRYRDELWSTLEERYEEVRCVYVRACV